MSYELGYWYGGPGRGMGSRSRRAGTGAHGQIPQALRPAAGVESTMSQGVRAFGLRRARYRGLIKTTLQNVATAAAVNLDRLAAEAVRYTQQQSAALSWRSAILGLAGPA